jgi:hypothetical protein
LDPIVANCDVAIKFGDDQQASGADARKRRVSISSATEPANAAASDLSYYEPYSIVVTNWYGGSETQRRLRRLFVELPNDRGPGMGPNERGEAGTLGGTHGAQNVVRAALEDLRAWKVELTALRDIVQNSLGLGAAQTVVAM